MVDNSKSLIVVYQFNFKTRKLSNIFNNVKYVVNNSSLEIECEKDEAVVVELFDRLFVGIPVYKLGTLTIGNFNSETTGFFYVGHNKLYFSIHDDVLYLRKRY